MNNQLPNLAKPFKKTHTSKSIKAKLTHKIQTELRRSVCDVNTTMITDILPNKILFSILIIFDYKINLKNIPKIPIDNKITCNKIKITLTG